jgi:hypothetical protein
VGWTDSGILRFSIWLRPAHAGGSVLEVNHFARNAVQDNLFITAIEISDCGYRAGMNRLFQPKGQVRADSIGAGSARSVCISP